LNKINIKYGFSKKINLPFEEAVEKTIEELKKEGFGILTEIDVKDTFKKKLNIDFKKYKILGACNPSIAYKAFLSEEQIGLLLPCNVVVYENENYSVVSVFNPMMLSELIKNEEMVTIASEVKEKLQRALAAI
jgi:uncharacterized protein (DUF302 family)